MRNLVYYSLVLSILMFLVLMLKFGWIHLPSSNDVSETNPEIQEETIENIGEIDVESGLIIDEGLDIVKAQCGACHSTKLVAQNRFSRDGWVELIRWMQNTQNLWDLGEQEVVILDYLEKHFSPQETGRRKNLEIVEWYTLDE